MKSYEKLSQESDKSWHAFVCYRDMGVERSTAKVGQRLGKSKTLMDRWSSRHGWVARVLAYDADQDKVRQLAEQKAIAKATEKAVFKREITAQKILEEQGNLAFARITQVLNWQGVDGLVDSDQIPDEVAAAIESVEITRNEDGGVKHKVKFYSKHPALARLGENKKLWGSKDDTAPVQQNFVQFFLEAVKSGELQREAERRGITPRTIEAEVIEAQGKPQG